MPSLALTPRGHLLFGAAGAPAELPDELSRRLADAFGRGSGYGLLELGATEVGTALPADLGYWRDFAARFVAAVCAHPDVGASEALPPPQLTELDRTHDAVGSAREAVRARVDLLRKWASQRPDPVALDAHQKRLERERAAHAGQLAALRRVLVHAYPAARPEAATLVDIGERRVETLVGHELACVGDRLATYEVVGAVGVRALLRALGVDPGKRRLHQLGPPQKTIQLNQRGRTLAITTPLLVQGSCGIGRPFGEPRTLRTYLDTGAQTKFRWRLESDAKSLYALYQYGRLHGAIRLRWRYLDEMLPAPWVHRDEVTLHTLMRDAHDRGVALEVVIGGAPGWEEPWSRAQLAHATTDRSGTPCVLVDAQGWEVPRPEVQLARLATR